MINVEKVRRWVVGFDCFQPMESLPAPGIIVGEVEGKGYRMPQYENANPYAELGGQLTIVLSGRGLFTAAGSEHEIPPGSAFLYRDHDHGVSYRIAPNTSDPWKFVWISFHGASVERLIEEINTRYGYVFHVGLDDELTQLLLSYRAFAGKTLAVTPLEGAGLVVELLSLLCRHWKSDKGEAPGTELARRVRLELDGANDIPLSVSALARKIGFSREHLSKTFHEETGQTFRDYRANLRLQKAITLLQKSNMSCKEIARHCNYGSYSSFFRALTNAYRVSPEEFHRNSNVK